MSVMHLTRGSQSSYTSLCSGHAKCARCAAHTPCGIRSHRRRSLCAAEAVLLAVLFLILFLTGLGLMLFPAQIAARRRNVVLMISDGYGPAGATLGRTLWSRAIATRSLSSGRFGTNANRPNLAKIIRERYRFDAASRNALPLDRLLVGSSRTASASSLVTDSAAGATAFACGIKTANGAISVNKNWAPCATFFEAASHLGWKTGLVVKSRITHATPAAFNAHVLWRDYEADIAVQQIGDYPLGRVTDLMFGGGREFFVPRNGNLPSSREDDRDLLKEAEERFGFQVIQNRSELLGRHYQLPVLGLFADSHLDYENDRNTTTTPSLVEMTKEALRLLKQASDFDPRSQGFVLMIEGSRIDMASHSNDAATSALESLEYQAAVQLVKDFIAKYGDTVLISTSDHETGGLSLARQTSSAYPDYRWLPDVLLNQSASTFSTAQRLRSCDRMPNTLRHLLLEDLGIANATDHEIERIAPKLADGPIAGLALLLGDIVSRRAEIGWATEGHTGVDVNLYVYGDCAALQLCGNVENTEIGLSLEKHLGVSEKMRLLTRELRQNLPPLKPRPQNITCRAE